MKRIAALITLMALALPAQAAEIFSEKDKLWLVGEIVKGDADRFVALLTPEIRHVYVYSRGGDYYEAASMALAVYHAGVTTWAPRIIDPKLRQTTKTPELEPRICGAVRYDPRTETGNSDCICASACALIWLAGVKRLGDVILVHRPHPPEVANMHIDDAVRAMAAIDQSVGALLKQIETPQPVIDKVLTTLAVRALTVEEMAALRARE